MRCPVCGSRNVTKLKTESYKCNDCGFIFYPDRDAIIDMRDMLDASAVNDEEMEVIGEKIKTVSEEVGKKIYGEDVRNVFKLNVSFEEIANKYTTEEYVYGVFVDLKDGISGTLILIIPEHTIGKIISKYNMGVVDSLQKFAYDTIDEFKSRLGWDAGVARADVAYDNMISMINYLTSELRQDKTIVMLNYEFVSSSSEEMYGDMLFMPTKNSLGMLRRFI